MGIVRDITVDQLTQAVNNIDTSTLAQDSTLHDVVTAISNISGGSDPVTNTTVNTLCKDTTGQSIATAITALGSTLGSDKANIDGSNIANPSAFRSAIGIHIDTDVSCTSDANAYAPTGLSTQLYTLVQTFANGILTIPLDGGDGYWYMLFLKPSDMSRYANLNRSCTLIYIDN